MAAYDLAKMEAYIREQAKLRGMDPEIAVKVAKSEGLQPGTWQSTFMKDGKQEESYGPFQLFMGGGLGNEFQQKTGLDPSNPETAFAQVPFALDKAKEGGWGPWYGAKRVGITDPWTGIKGSPASDVQITPASDTSPMPTPSSKDIEQEQFNALLAELTGEKPEDPNKPKGILDFMNYGGVPFGMRLQGLGAGLIAAGTGQPVDPDMMAMIPKYQEHQRKLALEKKQKELNLKYALKSNNPEVLATVMGGGDIGDAVKIITDKKSTEAGWANAADVAEKKRIADAAEYDRQQEAKLAALPEEERIKRENSQAYIEDKRNQDLATGQMKTWFGGEGTPPTGEVPVPMPGAMGGTTIPKVDAATVTLRKQLDMPTLDDAQAQRIIRANTGGPEKLNAEIAKIKAEDLATAQFGFEKSKVSATEPGKLLTDPTGKIVGDTGPKPPEYMTVGGRLVKLYPGDPTKEASVVLESEEQVPAEARTAMWLAGAKDTNPKAYDAYMEMIKGKSGATPAEDLIYMKRAEEIVGKTFPAIAETGRKIASSETDMATMRQLLENGVPQGMSLDSLIADYLPGYSNKADTLKSIIYRMAPQNYVQGTGAQSDLEYKGLLAALPKILNTKDGNLAIISLIEAKRAVDRERASIVSQYDAKKLTFTQAQEKLDELNKRSFLDSKDAESIPDDIKRVIKDNMGAIAAEGDSNVSSEDRSLAISKGVDSENVDYLTPDDWKAIRGQ